MPENLKAQILIVPFNDPSALRRAFDQYGSEIATLIMEPVNYDSGCIVPVPGFLELCRDLCHEHGSLLFFDEVLTAFRMAPGGAQQYLGVVPDICVLGKALGAGLPISAIAGRRDVMMHLRPGGDSECSGTYLAHLTAVLAALAALEVYSTPGFYENLNRVGKRFYDGFEEIIQGSGVPLQLQYVGPRFGLYFGIRDRVTNYRGAARQDRGMLYEFIRACFSEGVYFHVSPHHGFSAAHTEEDVDEALSGIERAMERVARRFGSLHS